MTEIDYPNNNDHATAYSNNENTHRRRRFALGTLAFLVAAAVILVPVAAVMRNTPRDSVPTITKTQAKESFPSVSSIALVGDMGGSLLIQSAESFEENNNNSTTTAYYLTSRDLNTTTLEGVTDPGLLALYLGSTTNLTSQEIIGVNHSSINEGQIVLRIGLVNDIEFPVRLPESFRPGDYEGAIFLQEVSEEEGVATKDAVTIVFVAPFASPQDPVQGTGNASATTNTTTAPLPAPDSPPSNNIVEDYSSASSAAPTETKRPMLRSSAPTVAATAAPSTSPTGMPTTKSPTPAPTRNPTPVPTAPELPPVLVSTLNGSYNIDGSITIDYTKTFRNGAVEDVPRLRFDIPNLSNAPGPYLYLSKRPYSETRSGDLDNGEDLFVPIDSGSGGQFNVKGRFDQFLDEIGDVEDLHEYANGSWIVWCRPFGVWIGGGAIN